MIMVINKGREAFRIYKNVFDNFTIQTILKFMSRKYIDGLIGPIMIGKEANIFLAEKGDLKVVMKIYRLQSCNFNTMYGYLKSDPRYVNLKKQRRKVIFKWVQREFRNLKKSNKIINAPKPYSFLNNVLLMEYIGDENPAPQLKDKYPKNPKKFYDEIITFAKKMYEAGLVHADLSEYNILNFNESPVFIDMSQSTSITDYLADDYLKRDINIISNFFIKNGLEVDVDASIKRISD
jgi:RIO kinase 1